MTAARYFETEAAILRAVAHAASAATADKMSGADRAGHAAAVLSLTQALAALASVGHEAPTEEESSLET